MTYADIDPERLTGEWQARILGIVATLIDAGTFTWADFRTACLELRAERATDDGASTAAAPTADTGWADLEDWAPALRRLLEARSLLPAAAP